MSIAAFALLAALAGPAATQDEAALEAGLASALGAESPRDVRVMIVGGPAGPGRLDSDGDGVVTREEFSAPISSAFDRLDGDADGRLTSAELAAGHGEGPGAAGAHGMMMRGPGGPAGHAGPMVLHGEGSREERVFMFRHGGREGGPTAGGPGERRVEIRRFGGPGGHDGMDTDNDGKVSEAEFLAPLREAFQSMDADHDGALEEGEDHHAPPSPPAAD